MTDPAAAPRELRLLSPLDLHPLPPLRVTPEAEVRAAVARARAAQPAWAALSLDDRVACLTRAAKVMLARRREALALIREEEGKCAGEVLLGETLGPLDFVKAWARIVRPYIRTRKLPISALAFPGKSGYVTIEPRGVIGVIAPWNFPLAGFFKPAYPILLTGNGLVIKPSEYAPRTAAWFVSILAEHLPKDLVQCVPGDGATGTQLIDSGIDALVFTGSVPTGRKVVARCAERMIPVSVELGGKDPAIVLADCELERTVAGVLNWACASSGQNCAAIERVYVVEAIADRFIELLAGAASRLRVTPTDDPTIDVGPLVNERQLQVVEEQVRDAVAKGAKVLCGGQRANQGYAFPPTVLIDCTHEMKVMTEETFGPLIPVMRVKDEEEAVRWANQSRYGLNASVWTRDLRHGEALARRLEAGVVLINNHAVTGGMAYAPWAGVKDTGYGVANSEFALATYTRPRTCLIDRNRRPDPWWFPMDELVLDLGDRLSEAQLGRFTAALKVPLLMRERARRILALVRGDKKALPPR